MSDNTNILRLLDVVELVGYDTDNSTILQEIIDDYDKEIAYALKHNKVAKIPYIGNIRRNAIRKEFKKIKNSIRLTDIRKTMTKEEYKNHTKELYISAANKARRDDRLNVIYKVNRALNRNKYDRLVATAGKPYANMYIYCMGLMSVIPTTPVKESNIEFKFKLK